MKAANIIHADQVGTWAEHLPAYSDMCPVCGPEVAKRVERNKRVLALHKSLVAFGYTSLTFAETSEAYDLAMDTTRTTSAEDGIIVALIRSQLIEAGLITTEETDR
jgi:hypothetical protein